MCVCVCACVCVCVGVLAHIVLLDHMVGKAWHREAVEIDTQTGRILLPQKAGGLS